MKLDEKERLILINQYTIIRHIDPDNAHHYEELIEILRSGYEIFYPELFNNVYEGMTYDEGRFVLDILSIYRMVEDYKVKNADDDDIKNHHFGTFRGFDGNNETAHMSFTRFLVNTQGKFSEQEQYKSQNDDFNSHHPTLEKYGRMIHKWQTLGGNYQCSKTELLEILNA